MQNSYVGFIFGGDSAEGDVSVITALTIEKKMRGNTVFSPVFIYMSRSKKFYLIDNQKMNIDTFKSGECESKSNEICFLHGGKIKKVNGVFKKTLLSLDCVINCCHGGEGECGDLAGYMKVLNIPFSTSNHTALGLSMDKNLFKKIMKNSGIAVPSWVHFTQKEWLALKDEIIKQILKLKFPIIVKPNSSGSSLGITIVEREEDLVSAIMVAFEFDSSVIVEKVIVNKIEFNCAVLGSRSDILVSDVDQIENKNKFFSFEEKYIGTDEKPEKYSMSGCDKGSGKKSIKGMEIAPRLLPAPISDKLKKQIQELSYRVFSILGLSGISRVDFLYDKHKNKLYVGEINAVPGSMALYFFKNTKLGEFGVISRLALIAKEEMKSVKSIDKKFIPKIY